MKLGALLGLSAADVRDSVSRVRSRVINSVGGGYPCHSVLNLRKSRGFTGSEPIAAKPLCSCDPTTWRAA